MMDTDDPDQLTRLTTHGSELAWSPDGSRIAFSSIGPGDIYVVYAGDGRLQQLTDSGDYQDMSPTWSPDGQRILFLRSQGISVANDHIWMVNSDGSDATKLTEDEFFEWTPAWSPAGDRIAFGSKRDDNPDLYVVNTDGSGLQRLTDDAALERDTSWAPDGKWIAFTRRKRGQGSQVYVIDLASGASVCLSEDGFAPMWSPDGQWILFLRDEDLDRDGYAYHKLWIVSEDGRDLIRLSED